MAVEGYDPVVAELRALLLDFLARRDLLTRIDQIVNATDVNGWRPRRFTRERALLAIQALARSSVAQRGAEIEYAARQADVPLTTLRDSEHQVWALMAAEPAYADRPDWRHPWDEAAWR